MSNYIYEYQFPSGLSDDPDMLYLMERYWKGLCRYCTALHCTVMHCGNVPGRNLQSSSAGVQDYRNGKLAAHKRMMTATVDSNEPRQ